MTRRVSSEIAYPDIASDLEALPDGPPWIIPITLFVG
jgi:hypothetical protein